MQSEVATEVKDNLMRKYEIVSDKMVLQDYQLVSAFWFAELTVLSKHGGWNCKELRFYYEELLSAKKACLEVLCLKAKTSDKQAKKVFKRAKAAVSVIIVEIQELF